MRLVHIKSTITPKDYSVLRNILKQEQGEKIAPLIFKLGNLNHLERYLVQERIKYEVYLPEPRKNLQLTQELDEAEAAQLDDF